MNYEESREIVSVQESLYRNNLFITKFLREIYDFRLVAVYAADVHNLVREAK